MHGTEGSVVRGNELMSPPVVLPNDMACAAKADIGSGDEERENVRVWVVSGPADPPPKSVFSDENLELRMRYERVVVENVPKMRHFIRNQINLPEDMDARTLLEILKELPRVRHGHLDFLGIAPDIIDSINNRQSVALSLEPQNPQLRAATNPW